MFHHSKIHSLISTLKCIRQHHRLFLKHYHISHFLQSSHLHRKEHKDHFPSLLYNPNLLLPHNHCYIHPRCHQYQSSHILPRHPKLNRHKALGNFISHSKFLCNPNLLLLHIDSCSHQYYQLSQLNYHILQDLLQYHLHIMSNKLSHFPLFQDNTNLK